MRRATPHFDLLLLGSTVLLVLYGIIMIYSATYLSGEGGQSLWDTLFARQIIYALAGLGLMFLATIADYRYLENLYRPLYILTILSLLLIRIVGRTSFGAQRWLGFGRFQPSELAKLFIIIGLAKYLSDRGSRIKR
ncbi:MAG: FtsW/RodA/SpoVE family cell cycle protein, partial [Anaerolineae bacterium]